jgi:hypothetical protein
MKPTLRYNYNLPWKGVIAGRCFYAGLSIYLARLALGGEGVVCIVLATLSVLFAGLGLALLARRIWFSRVLELSEETIRFPRGFLRTRINSHPYA